MREPCRLVRRYSLAALLTLTPGGVQAQQRPPLTATFVGGMAVHVTDGSTSLLTDFPYESGVFGSMEWTKALVPGGPKPLCLITHSHRDHFKPDLASEYCARLLGPEDVTKGFGGEVVPISASVPRDGLTIRVFPTPHARLEHYSYRVSWHGRELYFTGDTDDASALLAQKGLDVAFVSPWLLDSVLKQAKRIAARQVVLYHHDPGTKASPHPDVRVPTQGERLELP